MIEDQYQMVNELNCEELYFLKGKEHLKSKAILNKISKKCGLDLNKFLYKKK